MTRQTDRAGNPGNDPCGVPRPFWADCGLDEDALDQSINRGHRCNRHQFGVLRRARKPDELQGGHHLSRPSLRADLRTGIWIDASGVIDEGTTQRLLEFLRTNRIIEAEIVFDSPGGSRPRA